MQPPPLIVIAVRFTAGQYSARPWGALEGYDSHEWPPSPYRLMRAATAAWKYNLPDLGEELFFRIVQKLASERPSYCLPRVRRTRGGRDGRGAPPPWGISPSDALYAVWPLAALAEDERAALEEILGHVHYLGRTDSWCEMRLAGADAARAARRVNCRPYSHKNDGAASGAAPVRMIVPRPDVTMDEVYRKYPALPEEISGACPDGAEVVPYLIDAP